MSVAYVIFMSCIAATIPNQHQVHYLPDEQKDLIYEYAQQKCSQEAGLFDNQYQINPPRCNELGEPECM